MFGELGLSVIADVLPIGSPKLLPLFKAFSKDLIASTYPFRRCSSGVEQLIRNKWSWVRIRLKIRHIIRAGSNSGSNFSRVPAFAGPWAGTPVAPFAALT
jgi:hypothetical protein